MENKLFCIYSKKFKARTGAQWRIIQVREEDERDDMPSLFVLCTKKNPQQFLYMEKSFFEFARGLEETKPPTKDCLFKVSIFEHIRLHKHIQMVRTQVPTTYEVHTKYNNLQLYIVV